MARSLRQLKHQNVEGEEMADIETAGFSNQGKEHERRLTAYAIVGFSGAITVAWVVFLLWGLVHLLTYGIG